jgi:type I restriction enzyme, S subunit
MSLPNGWAGTTLGQLGDYINGRAFKPTEWTEHGRPIIRIQNLTGSSSSINRYDGQVEERYIVRADDLLISWSATLGAYFWNGEEAVLNQHIFKVRSGINKRFHKYLVDFTLGRLQRQTHGSGMVHITRKPFNNTEVALPPLPEQERIVAAIEEEFSRIDAGMAALLSVRLRLRQMRAAVLQAAVTGKLVPHTLTEDSHAVLVRIAAERVGAWKAHTSKPYKEAADADTFPLSVPDHWQIASLEALSHPVRVICYGILMPKENIVDGIPYVRVKDMKGWTIDVPGLKRTSQKIADQYARASLKAGDLLLAIRGSYGRVAVIPAELDGANITQDSARIAANDAIDRRYLLYYLGGSVANRYYHRVARGVAVKGVNIGDLRSMPVPFPPPHEQAAIADEVERYFTLLDQIEATVESGLRRGSALRSAILATAFAGILLPQDSSDEPASILLERIAVERTASNGHRTTRSRIPRRKVTP